MLTPNSIEVESSLSCRAAAYEEFSKSVTFEFPWQLGSWFSRRHLSTTADCNAAQYVLEQSPILTQKRGCEEQRDESSHKKNIDR